MRAPWIEKYFPSKGRHVEAARPHEAAGLLVGDEGVVVPTVPEQTTGLDELFRHGIALGMRRMRTAEHGARLGVGRRDHVPARAPAGQVIERGEAAGDMIGLGISGRGGRRQSQSPRAHGQRGEQAQRLELADRGGMLVVARGKSVAQEEHVEPGRLRGCRDVLHQREVGRPRVCLRVAPAADMMAGRLHEDAEAHLAVRRLHYEERRVTCPTAPGSSTAKSTVTLPAFSKTSVTGTLLPANSGEARSRISR